MAAAAIPLAISAIGSLIGGISGGRPQVNRTNETVNSSNTFSQTPNLDPLQKQLRDALIGSSMGRLNSAEPDLGGIQSQMLQNVNTGYNSAQNVLRQTLAARGLSYSPSAAYAENNLQGERIGGGINVMNQMPMLREQLLRSRLMDALNVFRGLPFGTSGSQSGTQNISGTGQMVQPGGMLSGLGAGMVGASNQIGGILDSLFGGKAPKFNPGSAGFGQGVSWNPNSFEPPPNITPVLSGLPSWLGGSSSGEGGFSDWGF